MHFNCFNLHRRMIGIKNWKVIVEHNKYYIIIWLTYAPHSLQCRVLHSIHVPPNPAHISRNPAHISRNPAHDRLSPSRKHTQPRPSYIITRDTCLPHQHIIVKGVWLTRWWYHHVSSWRAFRPGEERKR